MFSQLDRAIWEGFNFYREDKWIPAAIPMIIFSVVSIKRFVSDTDAEKKEGRHRKTNVKLMFIISIVFCFYLLTFLSRWFLVFI